MKEQHGMKGKKDALTQNPEWTGQRLLERLVQENETTEHSAQGPPAGPVFGTLLFHCRVQASSLCTEIQAILSLKVPENLNSNFPPYTASWSVTKEDNGNLGLKGAGLGKEEKEHSG